MSDACVMQGRAPTPLVPPAGVTPARERYTPSRRYIAQPAMKRAAPHKGHQLLGEQENVLGTSTVANMRTPLKGCVRQCSPFAKNVHFRGLAATLERAASNGTRPINECSGIIRSAAGSSSWSLAGRGGNVHRHLAQQVRRASPGRAYACTREDRWTQSMGYPTS